MVEVSFDDLIKAAKAGEWGFIDHCLESHHLTPERIRWAIAKGVRDADVDVRELAATVLQDSDSRIEFTDDELRALRGRIKEEECDLVRYRIAIALYRRRNREPEVLEAMNEAALNRYIYEEARALLDANA